MIASIPAPSGGTSGGTSGESSEGTTEDSHRSAGRTAGDSRRAAGDARQTDADARQTGWASRRAAGDSVQRLMDAAVDAFADKGFHATSTRDIAARANMSPAGVYVHFASKQDLLFQLCRHGHVLALEVVDTARRSADTPPAQLVAIVSAFASWHAEQFRTARIVQYEFPNLTPAHRAEVMTLRKRIDAVVKDVLQAGVASGDFDVPDVAMATLALQSLTIDIARWYKPGIKRTPGAIGAAYGDLSLRMVRA